MNVINIYYKFLFTNLLDTGLDLDFIVVVLSHFLDIHLKLAPGHVLSLNIISIVHLKHHDRCILASP